VRKTAVKEDKLYDEEGNEIEFEGEVEGDEDFAEEEVVQKDEDEEWEDEEDEEDEEMAGGARGAGGKKEIWDESKAPL